MPVEGVICVIASCKCRCVCTNQVYSALFRVQLCVNDSFGTSGADFDCIKQFVSDCKADTMLTHFIFRFPLPGEGVASLFKRTRFSKPCFLESHNIKLQSFQLIVDCGCFSHISNDLKVTCESGSHCPDVPAAKFHDSSGFRFICLVFAIRFGRCIDNSTFVRFGLAPSTQESR